LMNLKDYFEEAQKRPPHLRPKITKAAFARALEISRKHLYWILQEGRCSGSLALKIEDLTEGQVKARELSVLKRVIKNDWESLKEEVRLLKEQMGQDGAFERGKEIEALRKDVKVLQEKVGEIKEEQQEARKAMAEINRDLQVVIDLMKNKERERKEPCKSKKGKGLGLAEALAADHGEKDRDAKKEGSREDAKEIPKEWGLKEKLERPIPPKAKGVESQKKLNEEPSKRRSLEEMLESSVRHKEE